MKITTAEEREAHQAHVVSESLKGTIIGGTIAGGVYKYIQRYHEANFRSFSPTIKACLIIMPTIFFCAFWAEEGSREFDMRMHSESGGDIKVLQEYQSWKNKSLAEQIKLGIEENKFKLLTGAYGGSFFLAQELARRKVGIDAQRIAKRNYLMGSTVLFLVSAIALSRPQASQAKRNDEWKKYLDTK